MKLTHIHGELGSLDRVDPSVQRMIDYCSADLPKRPVKILIVGHGPYDPGMRFGGKSILAHELLNMDWPGVEVEYHDLSQHKWASPDVRVKEWKNLVFDEVSQMSSLEERCTMGQFASGCEDLVKPVRKLYGPNNHSKHSRQGRANRWR